MKQMFRMHPLFVLGTVLALSGTNAHAWAPKQAHIMTKWARLVDPKAPLPEYPRPQFVRKDWLNLNGIWQYQSGSAGDPVPTGTSLSSEILVPFAPESALSGVMEHHERLWYRRTFTVPTKWSSKRILLNFGAVDFESEVYINGKSVGIHKGGYLPFSYDITPYLRAVGPQELIVRVYNAVDGAGEPRGKQTLYPGGIMYTPTTGIWQTVWLEPVNDAHIDNLRIIPDIDRHVVNVSVNSTDHDIDSKAVVKVISDGMVISTVTTALNHSVAIDVPHQRLWSPDSPYLYDLDVTLINKRGLQDTIKSYFGMRKISIGLDHGIKKMFLNNKFLFEIGPLDQGFWPDGIYTQPTEAALKSDIQAMKTLGFNMVRKHIKVEPARWYYWTDKLGLLVWQDMPSANSYTSAPHPPPVDVAEFKTELADMVKTHWNVPSIIMWEPFNEGQGQHDTPELVAMIKKLDPTRLVDEASGGGYTGSGDVIDAHSYPPPACPAPSTTQALVCGEYGGIGLLVPGHTWKDTGGGYTEVRSGKDLEELYGKFAGMLKTFRDKQGLSAAVYTQITDVETELNGLMTYDRVFKCDPKQIALANHFKYPVPTYVTLVPTSELTAQTWQYTTDKPATDWMSPSFDDTSWTSGPGGFGHSASSAGKVRTEWTTDDIWIRRTFNPGSITAEQAKNICVRDYHDEDIDVYINGVLAYTSPGYIGSYEVEHLTSAGAAAIKPNSVNVLAVHCKQTTGGQYIDVGLSLQINPKK